MKRKLVNLALTIVIFVSISGFLAFTEQINANAASITTKLTWIDNFDSETLDSRWTWVRENPTYWSLTDNPGFFQLQTRGSLHLAVNNLENILLFSPSTENFSITTKVTFLPTANYQAAGLIVYQDDDNYVSMTRVYADGDNVRIKQENDGTYSIFYGNGVTESTIYLRLDKVANDYYGFYSIDGDVWEFVGQFNRSLSNIKVGLMGSDGETSIEVTADFDYFEFIPRTYNKTWIDDFNSETLDSAWSWINEDPTHWSLTTNPGFMQIITQNGSLFIPGTYHNLLVKEAPSEDYQITTRVTISPTTEIYQGVYIVVYGDDKNHIRIGRRFANDGNEINFRHMSEGNSIGLNAVSENATSVYLRITKEGDLYSGFYSINGISYTYIGQTSRALTNPKIGILSENGPSTTEIPSDYDFFEVAYNLQQIFLPFVKR
jgi:beta-xylosidase